MIPARAVRRGLGGAVALGAALAGALLIADRPGLGADYFALAAPWSGAPLGRAVGSPGIADAADVGERLATPVVFSVRWSGWWRVEAAGRHRFFLDADDGGYLRVDGRTVAELDSAGGERAASGEIELAPGFHAIEAGYFQRAGEARFTLHWLPPGAAVEAAAALRTDDLYAGRPLRPRQALRRVAPGWPRPLRQLLGVLLLLAGGAAVAAALPRPLPGAARLRAALARWSPAARQRALLVALFAGTFAAALPYTGSVTGGDDTSYLDTATFDVRTWYLSRYAHVYLLKLFTALGGGDPLVGGRLWWSFALAATVAGLAVAVRSVGRGSQAATLAATLFALAAQPVVWGLIGAGFADFSAMMFVTLAVAVLLHGLAREREAPPPRRDGHALWVGALTVGALRSKEVGSVLLLLPLLFVFGPRGEVDWRRGGRKAAHWLMGAAGALVVLAILDGWILGDPLFSWDRARLAEARSMNFPAAIGPREESWLDVVWWSADARWLWVGVAVAAIAAGMRRREPQLRLLHLLPMVYLLALVALYVRLPHPFSNRMLIPILPVACLMNGLLLHYAGLDDLPWRRLLRPALLLPAGLALAALFLLAVPLVGGTLDPATLLPVEQLARYGWEPRQFAAGVLLPGAVIVSVGGLALVAGRPAWRLAALAAAYVLAFGSGFEQSRESLARRWAIQTSRLLVYPWQTFRPALDAERVTEVALSSDLRGIYKMTAPTRSSLAKLALRRPDLRVGLVDELPEELSHAIASRNTFDAWRRQLPALAETATFDPLGFLVLVRPREAAERMRQMPAASGVEPAAERSVAERLARLRESRDPVARRELLDWIVANPLGLDRRPWDDLQSLDGARLRALEISPDGWSQGTRPAALVVDNRSPAALAQPVTLAIGDATRRLPVEVFVDDGERVVTIRFDRAEPRTVELPAVPPFTTRLLLVWADGEWIPGAADPRALGVQIRAAGPP
jgi:hypothetical protein